MSPPSAIAATTPSSATSTAWTSTPASGTARFRAQADSPRGRTAIVKGYIDRVFGMGFGYGPITGGGNEPLLVGRRMLSFTASGAPTEWLREEGTLASIRMILDRHVAQVCGLQVLDHVHFGGVTPSMSDSAFNDCMRTTDDTVARLF